MQLHTSNLQQAKPYIAPFSHNTFVTDRRTIDGRQPWQQLDHYTGYSWL